MYDPATGARLPGVNAAGQPFADDAIELEIGDLP
jgi:hypothetical protein